MKNNNLYLIPVCMLLMLTVWLVRPSFAQDDAPDEASPNPALEREVVDLKERVAALERMLGEERESRPSVALRLRALEISVEELERQGEGDDDEDRVDDRAIRDIIRRLDTAETRIERMDRNRIGAVERRLDAAERDIRGLETRVRRLE